MALGSLLTLLDDIATVLDDVSAMTQVAAKKTSALLGDDLALNAEQVSGVSAKRELPVVWAVAKGSFLNKLILVPLALLMSYFAPWLITPLLMVGGAYLCFEGFEKITHKLFHKDDDKEHKAARKQALIDPSIDLVALEKKKIKGAIRTDFILSAEIIVIALSTVSEEAFFKQAMVVSLIAFVMTIGVYGLVAAIVRLDDVGIAMMLKKGQSFFNNISRKVGKLLIAATPYLMRTLTVLGTAAMFLVGGGIFTHGIPALHHLAEKYAAADGLMGLLGPILLNAVVGLVVGAILVGVYEVYAHYFAHKEEATT